MVLAILMLRQILRIKQMMIFLQLLPETNASQPYLRNNTTRSTLDKNGCTVALFASPPSIFNLRHISTCTRSGCISILSSLHRILNSTFYYNI